jgi:chitinase
VVALRSICVGLLLVPSSIVTGLAQDAAATAANAQPATISLPTFTRTYNAAGKEYSYTVIGSDPARGGTTTIPTVLVPITLTIEAPMDAAGKKAVLDASPDAIKVMHSPIFAKYAFASGKTQYTDAMMRTDF